MHILVSIIAFFMMALPFYLIGWVITFAVFMYFKLEAERGGRNAPGFGLLEIMYLATVWPGLIFVVLLYLLIA